MDLKFSVIIPTYNGLPYITRAIESVLQQEYPAHEIWVVDDGSTDGTFDALKQYGSRIKVKRIKNSGAAGARNAAIAESTGDFLAFLDSDDVWFKNKLRVVAEHIHRYPDIHFFSSDFILRYAHLGNRLVKHYSTLDDKRLKFGERLPQPLKYLVHSNFVGTPSGVVVRKDILTRTGVFNESVRFAEDIEIYLRISMETDFLLINRVLFYRRTHASNISNDAVSTYGTHQMILQETIERHRGYIRSHGLEREASLALARIDYQLGHIYFEAGRKRDAFNAFVTGLKRSCHPVNLGRFFIAFSKKTGRLIFKK